MRERREAKLGESVGVSETLRILYLEDEPNDVELVVAALGDLGLPCEVKNVDSRDEFVSALERGGIDLILSDYALPGFDGLSALEIAREKAADIPFIFVSGTLGEETAIESLRNGATDYVLKGRLSRLAPAARRALEESGERKKRKRAEATLRTEQQFLKALFESLEAGVVACNSKGQPTFFNRAAKDFHGLPKTESPGAEWAKGYELYHPDGKSRIEREADPLFRAFQGEQVRNSEVMIVPRKGPKRIVLTSGQCIDDARGSRIGAVVTMHDVTELKELEAQLRQAQKMEAIGQLAGGVAHDFNNLLNIIMGYCELALAPLGTDDALRSRLEPILQAAERAAALTRQLLAFSRKQVIEPKVLDLNSIVKELNKMLVRVIGEDIELVTRPGEALGRVKADPGQIEQILMNLVVNARDAMQRGGRLTLETADVHLDEDYARVHAGARPGRYVMLTVSDTGVGMDAAVQARIFEPFFTTKEPGKGTGLGLATVYGIVKQNGGYISVDSELGRGTTFRILLPLIEEPADALNPRENETPTPRGTETVLVVEDEEAVRELIRESLEGYGYTILAAAEIREAMEVCQRHRTTIDLLLTDVMLPGVSGREVAERLTDLRPGLRVLYTSGYTDDAILRNGVSEGAAFLQKPYGLTTLARKVRETLDRGVNGDSDKQRTRRPI